jgi:hypothetical protein
LATAAAGTDFFLIVLRVAKATTPVRCGPRQEVQRRPAKEL